MTIIRRGLSVLLESGSIAELRVPSSDHGTLAGLFDDLDKMAEAAAELSGRVPGIYFGLNPVKKSAAPRVTNRVAKVSSAVRDTDIQRRRWLPIDFDPIRPSDTPSTDAEHEAALAAAEEGRTWIRSLGWPEPLLADSGNGAALLYRIDLPNDQRSCELARNCLEALSLKFSNSRVRVDVGNFNASRIWRVYGTANRKGANTDERPYRRAKLLETPDEIETVSPALLKELASKLPPRSKENVKEQLDVAHWVAEHNVPVVADASWNNGGHKWILQCPWNESHDNHSAFVVRFADGGIAAGCLHKSCAARSWPDLRAYYERQSVTRSELITPPGVQKATQTRLLLELAGDLDLCCTPQGECYATVQAKDHSENHRVDSKEFKRWLRYQYFSRTNTVPRPQAVQEAVSHFDAVARYDSPREPVFIRVAEAGERNYLDLADQRWRAVEFSADGWRIVETPVVRFRRLPGMLPLPTPVRGGEISDLKTFLNVRTEDDWVLFGTTLLAAMFSRGPYAVLGIHGEAGSAKTTMSRVFRTMIDPNVSPSRAMPKDLRDLMIMAGNNWVLPFDNLSFLPVWFSDSLCRLSTGGGFSTRELYTNSDEVLFDGQRPVILNGIEELAARTDLLDRSVLLDLPMLENCREEREFWKEFEVARPRLLGALLDVAVEALRNLSSVRLVEKPRMADFAVLATAAESALSLSRGTFTKAYNRNRQNANAVALEASPIANPICDLVKQRCWDGTAEELLRKLSGMVDEECRKRRGLAKNSKSALRHAPPIGQGTEEGWNRCPVLAR